MQKFNSGTLGLCIGGCFLAIVLALNHIANAVSPTNPNDLEVGRFQLEGGFVIDTITGRVEQIPTWQEAYPNGMFSAWPRPRPLPPCRPPALGTNKGKE